MARVAWEGWLSKLGSFNRQWRRRFFRLAAGELSYHTKEDCSVLKGSITVSTISSICRLPDSTRFLLLTKERTWVLEAAAEDDLDRLISALGKPMAAAVTHGTLVRHVPGLLGGRKKREFAVLFANAQLFFFADTLSAEITAGVDVSAAKNVRDVSEADGDSGSDLWLELVFLDSVLRLSIAASSGTTLTARRRLLRDWVAALSEQRLGDSALLPSTPAAMHAASTRSEGSGGGGGSGGGSGRGKGGSRRKKTPRVVASAPGVRSDERSGGKRGGGGGGGVGRRSPSPSPMHARRMSASAEGTTAAAAGGGSRRTTGRRTSVGGRRTASPLPRRSAGGGGGGSGGSGGRKTPTPTGRKKKTATSATASPDGFLHPRATKRTASSSSTTSTASAAAAAASATPATAAAPGKTKFDLWEPAWTDDGRQYWYNQLTRETQWTKPTEEAVDARIEERIAAIRAEEAAKEQEALDAVLMEGETREMVRKWAAGKSAWAALATLDEILEDSMLPNTGLADLPREGSIPFVKVKKGYLKAIRRLHPDKLSATATTYERVLCEAVFDVIVKRYNKVRDAGVETVSWS